MACTSGPSILDSGLVLHLDAANPRSYPGSGIVWSDVSGNGNTGTLVNGTTFNSTNNGSIIFDGVNDYLNIPNSNYMNSNNFSITCWMYFNNITSTFTGYPFLDKNVYNTSGIAATIGTGGSLNNRLCNIRFSTSGNIAQAIGLVPQVEDLMFNAWHMISIIFSYDNINSYISLYIDNKLAQTSSPLIGTFVSNSSPLRIGIPAAGLGSQYVNGNISSYFVYNKALSITEIKQNFEATRGRYNV